MCGFFTKVRVKQQCLFTVNLYHLSQVLWGGNVIDPTKNDENVVALRALNDKLARDPRINISMLQLGDGTTLCFKK